MSEWQIWKWCVIAASGPIFLSWVYVWSHKLVASPESSIYVLAGVGLGFVARHFAPPLKARLGREK